MTAEAQLDGFLAKYTPAIEARARAILTKMRARLPGAVEIVYDNYNALAIGFGASERTSDAIFSIALYPRWVSLFFLQAKALPDPRKLLKGNGTVARHVVLETPQSLDDPGVEALIAAQLKIARAAIDPAGERKLVIKSISAKQRPRRPPGG